MPQINMRAIEDKVNLSTANLQQMEQLIAEGWFIEAAVLAGMVAGRMQQLATMLRG